MDLDALLGDDAESLLTHTCKGVPKDQIHVPGPDFLDRVTSLSDRSPQVLRNLGTVYNHGRLAGSGYLSILPVDQGIEHSAAASFAPNPIYFDPANIVELAIEGGCNAVATTFGVLGSISRKYAHRIPFIVKINHNELLTYPNKSDQVMFGSVKQAFDLGAAGVGATDLLRVGQQTRQLQEVAEAFKHAHDLGMFTVLWCYMRNSGLQGRWRQLRGVRRPDRSGQSSRRHDRGRHHQAEAAGEQRRVQRAVEVRTARPIPLVYDKLTTDHPIDLARWQVVNCYMGRIGLINSGGESKGDGDLAAARAHGRHQQARRWPGPDFRSQSRSSGRWQRASSC